MPRPAPYDSGGIAKLLSIKWQAGIFNMTDLSQFYSEQNLYLLRVAKKIGFK